MILFLYFLISAGVQRSIVLLTIQDEILFLLAFKKEIKTHLVFDCLSKFTFGQGFTQPINESYLHLYHTCVKKSIECIKKQPQMRLFQNNFRGYMTSSHKENELHSSHIQTVNHSSATPSPGFPGIGWYRIGSYELHWRGRKPRGHPAAYS